MVLTIYAVSSNREFAGQLKRVDEMLLLIPADFFDGMKCGQVCC